VQGRVNNTSTRDRNGAEALSPQLNCSNARNSQSLSKVVSSGRSSRRHRPLPSSLLWRLGRATSLETGLFEIQADHLSEFRQARSVLAASREVVYAMFGSASPIGYDRDPAAHDITPQKEALPRSEPNSVGPAVDPTVELTRCLWFASI
jgi:hypothetical protein